jgi:hypothetical protein
MRKPAPATVIALIALFVALGGTTYAATSLPANSVGTKQLRNGAVTNRTLHTGAVTRSKVAPNSLTGTEINSATLGTVPTATHAINADRATNAVHATSADHATNADKLAGAPASAYLPSCPGDLKRAPKTDLCFDVAERSQATWTDALKTCALAGLRLPDPGELAQAFNDLGAVQDFHWTTSQYTTFPAFQPFILVDATLLGQDISRNIYATVDMVTGQHGFRCVTTAYN